MYHYIKNIAGLQQFYGSTANNLCFHNCRKMQRISLLFYGDIFGAKICGYLVNDLLNLCG